MIAVIADDFTGAAEIGGVGLKYGLKVVIETEVKENGSTDLLVIAADTRSLNSTDAASEIERITAQLLQMNPEYIFKKLDSVFRGNIADELHAQLQVTGKKRAVVIAGNPSFGRLIENGIYTVNAVPLSETSFADDPDFPIRTSNVTEIVTSDAITTCSLPANSVLPENGIVIGDVRNMEELVSWAEQLHSDSLLAGGAGFFDTLIKQEFDEVPAECNGCMSVGDRALFVFGSKFPKDRQLPMGMSAADTVKLNMPEEIYASQEFDQEQIKLWAKQVIVNLVNDKKVIVTVEQDYSSEPGISGKIRKTMAELVKYVVQNTKLDDLLIEGGATTSGILHALGITKLYPEKLIYPGIIQMKTPVYPELTLTTKPGSYPWPESVKLEEKQNKSME